MARLLITGRRLRGSHTSVVLLEAGHELVVLDSFTHSSPVALDRVADLGGRPVHLVEGDIRDAALLGQLFADANATGQPIEMDPLRQPQAVSESVAEPCVTGM